VPIGACILSFLRFLGSYYVPSCMRWNFYGFIIFVSSFLRGFLATQIWSASSLGFFVDYSFFQPLVCAEILSKFSEGVVLTSPSLLVCSRFDALSGSLVCGVELMLGFDVSSWRGLLQSFEVLFLQACSVDFGWWG
jgi:hypothetical protein